MEPEERDLEAALRRRLMHRARAAVAAAEAAVSRSRVVTAGVRLARQPEGMLRRCAWCGRVTLGEEWVDGDEAERLTSRRGTALPASHTICPDCTEQLVQEGKSH
ncbi:MAG: hypothetical protein JO073_07830 [Actinobacteria bacterium]|nr:hypothetical protein [Actinomycetota bacterium]